ncbi:MAG TPA: hypothetical protein PKC21_01630 [Oligoflexia bacterium]|nr:hypothetical protein [Oligoflexia bacterium]HMR24032.1 hypothetical protein [Oligoflexia bacterium]
MYKMRYTLMLCVCFLLACDRVQVDFFNLGEFRLMAVIVDQPEVDASMNNTVSLTPWISDVDAQGRLVSLSIVACLDPGIGFGAEPTCQSSDPTYQQITYTDFDTNTLSAQYYSGAMDSFDVTIPSGLISMLDSETQFNGVDYIVSMIFTAGDEEIKSIKRIKLSSNPSLNQNPAFEDILVDGSDSIMIADGSEIGFTIQTGSEPEDYQAYDTEGTLQNQTENYLVTWFVSGGILRFSRTEPGQDNEFSLDDAVSGEPFVFGVLRDNRGGADIMFKD